MYRAEAKVHRTVSLVSTWLWTSGSSNSSEIWMQGDLFQIQASLSTKLDREHSISERCALTRIYVFDQSTVRFIKKNPGQKVHEFIVSSNLWWFSTFIHFIIWWTGLFLPITCIIIDEILRESSLGIEKNERKIYIF